MNNDKNDYGMTNILSPFHKPCCTWELAAPHSRKDNHLHYYTRHDNDYHESTYLHTPL